MKKLVSVLMALLLALVSICACAEAAVTTQTAIVNGRNGEMEIEVDLNGSEIAAVRIVKHQESAGVADPAIEMMPTRIVAAQSVAVDVVSGATLTSAAILNAVKDALTQAGLDAEAYAIPAEKVYSEETVTVDVVVIGGGGAGLSAAIEASNRGANVLLLERLTTLGGNTKLSQGMVLRGRTADEDETAMTAEEVYQIFYNYGHTYEGFNADIMKTFTESMAENTQWLMDMGYDAAPYLNVGKSPMEPDGDPEKPNRAIIMVHEAPKGGVSNGRYIIDAMTNGANAAGVNIMLDTGAIEILTDESGAAIGVVAMDYANNTQYTVNAQVVIIATGNKDGNDGRTGGTGYEDNGTAMARKVGAKIGNYGKSNTESIYIDEETRVLTEDGNVIANLYAVGEVTEIVSTGNCYVVGGARNAWSIYSGRIAGANAAAAIVK